MTATRFHFRELALVGRGVWIELLRRKDLYVLSILMAAFLFGVVATRVVGIENASTATFLLNLGLSLACYSAHLLTLLLVSRQVPDELEHRTIHPLLARPIDRSTYLAGKWAACALCGFAVLLVLGGFAWLAAPRLERYHPAMLAQTIALQMVSLSLLAALALFLSLVVPKGVNIVLCALLAVFGGKMLVFLRSHAAVPDWLLAAVPDFSRFNLVTRYTDAIAPLPVWPFLGLVAEGFFFAAVLLLLSIEAFDRRRL